MPHDDEVPPPPPSPPQPPLRTTGHTPVHVAPHAQPTPRPQPRPAAAAMFGEHNEQKQAPPPGPSPAALDASLPRTPDGKVAGYYVRILFTVADPPAGFRRTWARAHPQPLLGDSQEALRKMVQAEEKRTKLSGRKILSMKGMTPEKRRQIENALMHHQRRDPDPRFEWLPGMIKLKTEKDGNTTFTRSMDVILKRIPGAVIIQPSHPVHVQQQPQMHPQPHPQAFYHHHHPHAGHPAPQHQGHASSPAPAGGVEVVTTDDEIIDVTAEKNEDKGGKKEKMKKPAVHNNKPRVYTYSTESDSEVDSLFTSSDVDTPQSSIGEDVKRRRRSSQYRHGRQTSGTHGPREHKHRPPPPEPRPEMRAHHSRHGSSSTYSHEAQMRREDEERREREKALHFRETELRETELRLARTEGILEGMTLGERRHPAATPRLQIDDRAQYPYHPRTPRFGGNRYHR